MDLFIEIENGEPINHPYLGENLRECGINTNDLPPRYVSFVRIANTLQPQPDQVLENRYIWDGDVVRDDWYLRSALGGM